MNAKLNRPIYHGWRFRGAALMALATGIVLGGKSPAQAQADDDVGGIVRAIQASIQPLQSLHVKTRVETTRLGRASDDLARNFGATTLDEYAFAPGGKKFRCRRSWYPPKADAWSEDRVAYDGSVLRIWWTVCEPPKAPRTVDAVIQKDLASMVRACQANIYNDAVGCLFFDQTSLDIWRLLTPPNYEGDLEQYKSANPFPVVEALKTGAYRKAPNRETASGVECIVFEKAGHDKLWLAPSLGYAVVQRELRWPTNGMLMCRFTSAEFEAPATNCFLPRRVTREIFMAPAGGKTSESALALSSLVTVTDFVVNSVPESVFVFEFARGTNVLDFSRVRDNNGKYLAVSYKVGADDESTQRAIDRSITTLRLFLPMPAWKKGLIALGLTVALMMALYVGFRLHNVRVSRLGKV